MDGGYTIRAMSVSTKRYIKTLSGNHILSIHRCDQSINNQGDLVIVQLSTGKDCSYKIVNTARLIIQLLNYLKFKFYGQHTCHHQTSGFPLPITRDGKVMRLTKFVFIKDKKTHQNCIAKINGKAAYLTL